MEDIAGNVYYVDYTSYGPNGEILEAELPMEERTQRPVICSSCMGSHNIKKCGFSKKQGNMVSCWYYYPQPQNIKDWLKYYYGKVYRRYAWWIYKKKCQFAWFKWSHITYGSVPSIIKGGDIIKWKFQESYIAEKLKDLEKDMPFLHTHFGFNINMHKTKEDYIEYLKSEHELKIDKAWIMFEHNKFELMVCVNKSNSTLNHLLQDRYIVSINGKQSYKDPHLAVLF